VGGDLNGVHKAGGPVYDPEQSGSLLAAALHLLLKLSLVHVLDGGTESVKNCLQKDKADQ